MSRLKVKRIAVCILALAFSMILAGPAAADFEKIKVAVMDFQLQGEGYETEDMGSIVAEWFITALVKEGRFDVVERALLNKILQEQKLGMSGVVDESSATKIGKLLGVGVIISGSVLKLENILEVNARIIDVESASIIAAENVKSASSASLQQLIVQMSVKIIKNFPLEGYVVARSDDTVTIDLGKRAGVRQDMEFMVYKEGKIIKHPKTGEVLDVQKIESGMVRITSISNKIAMGEIVEEQSPGSITYGQMVKSIAGPLKPIERSQVYGGTSNQKTRRARPKQAPLSPSDYITKLRSNSLRDKSWAAKKISRAGLKDEAVLDVVEEELLRGYTANGNDRNHADTMSWLVKVLGSSGNAKYKETIVKVRKKGSSRKLRGYAAKALQALR